jgi:hypothetical protein
MASAGQQIVSEGSATQITCVELGVSLIIT